jgi:hypothetical protein
MYSKLLSNCQNNQQIVEEAGRLQLPDSTCVRRVKHLSEDLSAVLISGL